MTNLYPAHFNQFAIWKKFGRSLVPKVHYWGMAVEEISNESDCSSSFSNWRQNQSSDCHSIGEAIDEGGARGVYS